MAGGRSALLLMVVGYASKGVTEQCEQETSVSAKINCNLRSDLPLLTGRHGQRERHSDTGGCICQITRFYSDSLTCSLSIDKFVEMIIGQPPFHSTLAPIICIGKPHLYLALETDYVLCFKRERPVFKDTPLVDQAFERHKAYLGSGTLRYTTWKSLCPDSRINPESANNSHRQVRACVGWPFRRDVFTPHQDNEDLMIGLSRNHSVPHRPICKIKTSPILPDRIRHYRSHNMPMIQRTCLLQRCKALSLISPQDFHLFRTFRTVEVTCLDLMLRE